MKATGIVRKVDELGRVVIPKELRRTMEITEEDSMEIFVDGDRIILKKYRPGCVFCGESDPANIKIIGLHDKMICRACTSQIINANISSDLAAERG